MFVSSRRRRLSLPLAVKECEKSMSDLSQMILEILGAVGVAGVILFGLSSWLGNVWASRILAREQAKYDEALHRTTAKYDQHLEIARAAINRYSESQFSRYGELWQSLCDLRAAGDDLWESATPDKVKKFAKQIKETRTSIHKGALILSEEHYRGLLEALESFDQFSLGKTNLVDLRRHPNRQDYDEYSIQELIRHNGQLRNDYTHKLDQLRQHLKRQIGGIQ